MRRYLTQYLCITLLVGIASAKTDYKYVLSMIKPTASPENNFTDEAIKISFVLGKGGFAFTLENRTNEPITIDWDKISYVDVSGKSHRLLHASILAIERSKPQAPTTIPPRANHRDILMPADHLYIQPGANGGWKAHELFPKPEPGSKVLGKNVSISMPLEINGKVKDYNFVFAINIVAVQKP